MENKKTGLIQGLGLLEATTIVIGSMIGSGIFLAPSIMAQYIQTPGLIILLWIIGGIITICGALSYGELAASMPKAGGQYVFLREAYNPLMAFLYGWTVFLVIQTGFIAAVGVAFAKYLGIFIPSISENVILFQLAGFQLNSAQAVGILSIAVLTCINCFGLKGGAFIQNLFTFLKVLAVLVLIGLSFLSIKGNIANFQPLIQPILGQEGIKMGLFAALAVAMSKALFAYDAWNSVTFTAEETKNPQKNLPLSLLFGTLLVTLIYTTLTMAYFYIVPVPDAALIPDNRIAATVANILFGNAGLFFIAGAILISTFGCNNGLILSGPRVYYAMAKDGVFFKKVSEIHPKFHTPVNSLIYQGIWASILALTGTYSDLLTYVTFASLLFNVLTVIAVFVLRKKQPKLTRPYKTWGYPLTPVIYILLSVFFLIYIVQGDPKNSGLGIIIILTGLPIYYFWKNSKKKAASNGFCC